MPQVSTAESGTYRLYSKAAGAEPLPGYKLIAPLGRGGFGEVWKCEAPGGLHKAIKFVTSESEDGRGLERFGQELAAFEQIKAIRHPFLLTLERVEQVGNELVMVMELADRQLQDRFRECVICGLPGIPRDELLAYFADAAEALDVIAGKYNLQHLDVKPANLFLVSGHVKVGDYGLVAKLEGPDAGNRGLTPRYVAPEVLHGRPCNSSDQYSLALVYYELLTGEFPYPGTTPQQLMLQHVSGLPILNRLPPADQPIVGKALSKRPDGRYPSCLAFVQELMSCTADTAIPAATMNLRRARVQRSVAELNMAVPSADPSATSLASERADSTHSSPPSDPESTQNFTLPAKPMLTVPGSRKGPLPPLVSTNRRGVKTPSENDPHISAGSINFPEPTANVDFDEPLEDVEAGMVVLDSIRSVLPVAVLIGRQSRESVLDPLAFASEVVHAAAQGGRVPQMPGDVGQLNDGTWICQFPSTVPDSVVMLKLSVMREQWGVTIEEPDPANLVLRRVMGGGGLFGRKKYGYEVTILLPTTGRPIGEITVLGQVFGTQDPKFAREAMDVLPKLLASVRSQLGNVQDRRQHPRIACGLAVTLYPVHSDGGIDSGVIVKCKDVSLGGIGFATTTSLQTKYAYAAFTGIPAVARQAALIRLKRVQSVNGERHYGAQYRTDL